MKEAKRCFDCKNAPCSRACPSGVDIPSFIGKLAEEDVDGALEILMNNNPLPGICGRICHSPCQDECVKGYSGNPIQIQNLEKYTADEGEMEIEPVETEGGKEVAVVGSGPAGLTAGYFLARDGHRVTIFEKLSEPGGMLRYGIPDFRLSKDVLDREIDRIENMGLKIKLDSPLENIDDLFDQGYDAVFVGIGAHEPRRTDIPGEELEGVINAVTFLKKANLDKEVELGEKTAIIGCGDVAFDAARLSERLGSEALIVYRRSRNQMPATEEEYEICKREGIKFNFLTSPKRFVEDEGKVTSIECLKTELGEPDESGRKRPIPVEGSEFKIEVDTVIEAISQRPEVSWLEKNDLEINESNCIKVDEGSSPYETSRAGVFAAGDVVTGPRTVSWAIGSAKEAVKSIRKYLDSLS